MTKIRTEQQITNNMLAKLGIKEWLSILGSMVLTVALAATGYSNLLQADEMQTSAIVANTSAMLKRDKTSESIVNTQKAFSVNIQTIHLRLQAIEIKQDTSKEQQTRIEVMLRELLLRDEVSRLEEETEGVKQVTYTTL